MVLSSHHYAKLHGQYNPSMDDNCVVYSLSSKTFPIASKVHPPLPQPATIDSLPAAGNMCRNNYSIFLSL